MLSMWLTRGADQAVLDAAPNLIRDEDSDG